MRSHDSGDSFARPEAATLTLASSALAGAWARADSLLDAALELQPEARAAYLDAACADDTALRAQVERLLAGIVLDTAGFTPGGALAGAFGESLAAHMAAGDWDSAPWGDDLTGKRVDRYVVRRELGRGGMAIVYLAERADGQFEQRVALKVMSRGVDAASVVARFRQERQILARTRHPGIAALLDGGVTADGRPYFVMEYVEGRPIDRYCDEERLSLSARLRLFVQVAHAVEYAHRNLVVHRDIKPSNILVTAEGQAKLLDFGIAKRLDPGVDSAALTRADERLLTPAFASPEQLMGEAITTATDVYQLGLLLYVLLTGRAAYGAEGQGPASLLRAVVEHMPLRPSAAVGDLPTMRASADTAPLRAPVARATRLRQQLRGDLDNIVLMALRKEPSRRYGDVRQLAEDVERHLAGHPVKARADTAAYRAAKFIRRHALAVGVGTVTTLAVGGLVLRHTSELAHERDRARRAAAQSAQVSDFLQGLFRVAAPSRASGERLTARELLERGAGRIAVDLAGQPELQASMLTLVGGVYRELALYDEARPLLEQALALRRAQPGENGAGLAETLVGLGRLRHDLGALEESRRLLEDALQTSAAGAGRESLLAADAQDALGDLLRDAGDLPGAQAYLEQALTVRERLLGPDHPDVGRTLKTLARVRGARFGFQQAREPLERAWRILDRAYGPDHPYVAEVRAYLGDALRLTGEYRWAREHYQAALSVLEGAYGRTHPEVGRVLAKLGHLLCETGRAREARAVLERSLRIRRAAFGPRHVTVAASLNSLGRALYLAGDAAAARRLLEQSAAIYDATLGPEHVDSVEPLLNLAELFAHGGATRRARALVERVLAVRTRAYGAGHALLARPQALLRRIDGAATPDAPQRVTPRAAPRADRPPTPDAMADYRPAQPRRRSAR